MLTLPPSFVTELKAALSTGSISDNADDLTHYAKDWTRVFAPNASLLVRPDSVHEVVVTVQLAAKHGVALVPSGGRTGLAGGACATQGEVVVSLERMRKCGDIDTVGLTVRVEAGAVTEAVHRHVAEAGLFWPVDFASKGSSQVGGNIATNAGGVRVIRYGLTRQWVLGLDVVTGTGELLHLNGALEKNNTGIDLRQVFIGSEGTLGIITAATLKLTRLPQKVSVFLFALRQLSDVLRLFSAARQGPFTIMAFEFFDAACARRVESHRKLRQPFDTVSPYSVLLEVEDAPSAELERWLQSLFETAIVLDGTLAADDTQAKALWSLRESISESLSATGLPHKNDIALPIAALESFCGEFEALRLASYPDFELCLFGHIGDGNLHVNLMKPDGLSAPQFHQRTQALDALLFPLVQRHRGSISAEHGIGLLKKPWLHFTRSQPEIELMRHLKRVFDPRHILNPGKVFDL
jgi:FAD/FMN-containing dehydrogenase